ncbi:MAG: hypothetical protein AB7Y74_14545 [Syntrophorhabdus sp.]
MRQHYDFSKGERGKFYRPDIKLNLPIYLDDEVMAFVERLAEKKSTDTSSIVNNLLCGDMMISEVMQ